MPAAQIRIMGPVRVLWGNEEIRVGGTREKAVLASLVLEANRVVSVDRLIGALWGGDPPSSARTQVAICVSRLRRALREAGLDTAVTTASPGYLLRIEDDTADWLRFGSLTARAAAKTTAGDRLAAVALLREALSLWEGMPFDDLPGLRIDAHRLHEARLDATEACAELELELGRHDRVVADLAAVVEDQPLRERARGQLMLAQYRSGRRAEALRTYQDARRVLVEQIGLEPGPQLRELHERILRDEPTLARPGNAGAQGRAAARGRPRDGAVPARTSRAAGPVPSQLPRRPAPFAGRGAELHEVDRALCGSADSSGTVVLTGPADVGKTALALNWAHSRADRFPGGQLFASLRDEQGEPVATGRILERFLRAMGVAEDEIPSDPHERIALYRSTAARREMLVVLDDAADERQVLPLLPGCSACRVLVTSRGGLDELAVRQGATRLPVGPLPPAESRELLSLLLGSNWVDSSPHAAGRIAGMSGGNPLSLRRAAAGMSSLTPRG